MRPVLKYVVIVPLAIALVLLSACGGVGSARQAQPDGDLVLTPSGCTVDQWTLPATREPTITVANRASEAMVFSIPNRLLSITVAPQQTARLNLPRYVMGSWDFFCLTERAHNELNGGVPSEYMCSVDPIRMRPYALSSGMFTIAPHDRIQELNGATQP